MIVWAVSLSLFGGRWISYVGIPSLNLYLLDVLYFFGVTWLAISYTKKNQKSAHRSGLVIFLALFILIQLIRSNDYSVIIRIKDLAPFIYLLTTPILYRNFSEFGFNSFIKLCRVATILGAIWTNLAMIKLLHPIELTQQIFGVPIFATRWDHSGMSLCIGLVLWGNFDKFSIRANTPIRIFLALSILLQYSRASYVGLLLIVFFEFYKNSRKKRDSFAKILLVIFAFTIMLAPVFSSFLPENSAFKRLKLTNISETKDIFANVNESGTGKARLDAQRELLNWTIRENLLLFGSGPGREMIFESGAYRYLSGAVEVRSPHSWVYGSLCRYGILGFLFWHLMVYSYLKKSSRRSFPDATILSIIASVYVIGLFGVIIESPFGIMPFCFFLACSKFYKESK